MTIYLLQFNTYSNRQVKGYSAISSYSDYVISFYTNINFNPNDGVETSLILNSGTDGSDYLIACDETSGNIVSRWFILDATRLRNGQYEYKLRRDVIFDHLAEIKHSVAYIRKGWCNVNDSSIYNREALEVNQIKQEEILLKDKTKTPWIVGYLNPPDDAEEVSWKNTYTSISITQQEFEILSDNTSILADYIVSGSTNIECCSSGSLSPYANRRAAIYFNQRGKLSVKTLTDWPPSGWSTQQFPETNFQNENNLASVSDDLSGIWNDTFNSQINAEILEDYDYDYSDYKDYANKIVTYNGKYYKVTFQEYSITGSKVLSTLSGSRTAIFNRIRQNNLVTIKPESVSGVPAKVYYSLMQARPTLEEVVNEYKAEVPGKDTILKLNTQPYAMFAMPYYDYKASGVAEGDVNLQGAASLAIAQAISSAYSGSGALHDLQLVPYCPIMDYVETVAGETDVDLDAMPIGSYTEIVHSTGQGDEKAGFIFWCIKDTFTFDVTDFEFYSPRDPIEFKILNQSRLLRICSPNYSGAFEFSPTKNGDFVIINVDCTYKPYSPYIHLNPAFGSLYGQDFNDARGLICGGDFSLPQVNNAWETYQIQNKNYANSFNREVESIELRNKYALAGDIIGGALGAGSGAISGGAIGSTMGPGGAVIGAAVGAGLSAAGGAADVMINQRLREEALDLKKDQYNFSLQNIQALPTTLAKVGALNANNKLWPFLEVYDCLDGEIEAIRNKLLYNGFTIDKIAEIWKYIPDQLDKDLSGFESFFLQCQLIRTDIHDDWHMIRTIKDELEMGVFV